MIKEEALKKRIKNIVSFNLLGIEENLMENITISRGELGLGAELLIHLTDYVDDFVEDIMNIVNSVGDN